MDLQGLLQILEKYGIGGVLLTLMGFIIVSAIKSGWFSKAMSKISDKFLEKFMKDKTKNITTINVITESNITNHDLFNYIDFWTYSKVPTIEFSSEYRNIVFRRYLSIYLKSYKRKLSEFVNSKAYEKMDNSEMWKALLDLINQTIFDYEQEMINSNIPHIIIEKMKIKNNDTITLTIDLIEGICNSRFHESDKNFLKMYSILNILLSVLENTISNSLLVCNSINGGLKGLKIIVDGKTITENESHKKI